MSDLNDFLNSISSISSETIDLPKWIRIKQIGSSNSEVNSETSAANTEMNQVAPSTTSEDVSATSDNNQTALNDVESSPTSVEAKDEDGSSTSDSEKEGQTGGNISKLLQMLSSESDTEMNLSTATEQLEDQLKALLQAGGAMKKKASKKSKKTSKKSKKANKKSKKTSKKSKKANKKSKKTSKKSKKANKKSKKSSKKSKRKMKSEESTVENEASTQTSEPEPEAKPEPVKPKKKRTPSPGFLAFLDLKKHVAEKLGIPNGAPAAKVASDVKKETVEKFPELVEKGSVDIMKKAKEYFDKNIEKFKKTI